MSAGDVLKNEYRKERKRVLQIVRRAKKKGITLSDNAVPSIPKKITQASINRLAKITPKSILKYEIKQVKPSPQKTVKTRTRKSFKTANPSSSNYTPISIVDTVLRTIEDLIGKWQPSITWSPQFASLKRKDKNILQNILNGAIANQGREVVAKRIEENSIHVLELVERIIYGQSGNKRDYGVQEDLKEIAQILNGSALSQEESMELNEEFEE